MGLLWSVSFLYNSICKSIEAQVDCTSQAQELSVARLDINLYKLHTFVLNRWISGKTENSNAGPY